MKRTLLALTCMAALASCGKVVHSDGIVAVIPKPTEVTVGSGEFKIGRSTAVNVVFDDERISDVLTALNAVVQPVSGRELQSKTGTQAEDGAINLLRDTTMRSEEYTLQITPERVDITSGDAAGAFYAVQTLRQLIPVEAFEGEPVRAFCLPTVAIKDRPAMGYRGLMFDVCRHFFSVADVKHAIDIMALHKLNTLHWHLTDDQGWRIEIKKYPRLTEVGSVRKQTLVGYASSTEFDGIPYGGFYTQEQIREVVDYAAHRFITVVPEIEFPGHSVAALTAYPELGCKGEGYEVLTRWGVDDRVLCMGKESAFEFINGVLSEVLELFPSKYIHIGGDECPTVEWETCPLCQARMKAEGLKTERLLQGYATHRAEQFLNAHGRSLVGWDEILEGGVTPNATIMSWRGTKGGIQAARQGNHAIMTPTTHCYFDYKPSTTTAANLGYEDSYLPLAKVYSLDPYESLTEEQRSYILGVQCNLWTEYITTIGDVEYMLLPRMSALSEVGWSCGDKDYADYTTRLEHLTRLYEIYGYNYSPQE